MERPCESCGTSISQSAGGRRAVCDACIGESVRQVGPAWRTSPIARPAGISVRKLGLRVGRGSTSYRSAPIETAAKLVIARRWFSPFYAFLVAMLALWGAVLVASCLPIPGVRLAGEIQARFGDNTLGRVVLVGVGLVLGYGALVGVINRTTLTLQRDTVHVTHGPLPLFRRPQVEASGVAGVVCKALEVREAEGVSETYSLEVRTRDRRIVPLLDAVQSREQVLFIAQEIERHLADLG